MILLLLGSGAFFIALLAIIMAPLGADRVQRSRAPVSLPPPRDTAQLLSAIARERAGVSGAEAALDDARVDATAARPTTVVVDTFPAEARARRDSLATRTRELGSTIRRAADAPLPASFRALAAMPELRADSAARRLGDSIAAVEQARSEAEAAGAADTIFIALTQRLTTLGDSLVALATGRLAPLRAELDALAPEVRRLEPESVVDTMPFRDALAASRQRLAAAESRLAMARTRNDSLARLEAARREGFARTASPPVLIIAAAIIGVAAGFLAALFGEVRRPAIADGREAEVVSGIPVLARIGSRQAGPSRARRRADRSVPPLIDLASDRYARLYHRLADPVSRLPRLAVLGDHSAVVATVAANLATAAAHTARATLLLDTDFDARSVSSVLRVRAEPGIAEVLARRLHWSAAVVPSIVGRNRSVDVLPAGTFKGGGSLASAAESFAAEVANIARRYDTLLISAPLSRRGAVSAAAAAVPDAIICVRSARTSVRVLQRIVDEARRDGARLRGLVIWEVDEPRLPAATASVTTDSLDSAEKQMAPV